MLSEFDKTIDFSIASGALYELQIERSNIPGLGLKLCMWEFIPEDKVVTELVGDFVSTLELDRRYRTAHRTSDVKMQGSEVAENVISATIRKPASLQCH